MLNNAEKTVPENERFEIPLIGISKVLKAQNGKNIPLRATLNIPKTIFIESTPTFLFFIPGSTQF